MRPDEHAALSRTPDGGAVEAGALIGRDARIWPGAYVRAGAEVGDRCTIGRGAYIDAGVVLGPDCKIQNSALLYAPARLGAGVFIGPAAVLTNDRHPRAVTPSLTKKDASQWSAAGVEIGDGAAVGAQAVVVAGVTLGRWCLIGAGAVVSRDVPDYALVTGVPARWNGWVGPAGERLLSDGDGRWRCPATGVTFREVDGRLEQDVTET